MNLKRVEGPRDPNTKRGLNPSNISNKKTYEKVMVWRGQDCVVTLGIIDKQQKSVQEV